MSDLARLDERWDIYYQWVQPSQAHTNIGKASTSCTRACTATVSGWTEAGIPQPALANPQCGTSRKWAGAPIHYTCSRRRATVHLSELAEEIELTLQ
jgi:hypothetical protein